MHSKRRADGSGQRAQSMGSSMWSAAVNTADCSAAHRMGFTQSRRRGLGAVSDPSAEEELLEGEILIRSAGGASIRLCKDGRLLLNGRE